MNLYTLIAQSARMLRREWRSGELRVLALALLVSVTSVSGVGFFTERMERAMDSGATELLGADLLLLSNQEIDASVAARAHGGGLDTALTSTLRSVVVAGDAMQLVSLKAVGEGYPLRGRVLLADAPFAEAKAATGIPALGTAWADPRLLALLGLAVGDSLQVGRSRFEVNQVVSFEPDRGGDLFSIAPRLLINRGDLEATGLLAPGSRVKHRMLFAGEDEDVARFRAWLMAEGATEHDVQGVRDARPEIRIALERGGQFLGLAALVAVLLSGVAVAMSARQYAIRHLDGAALLRCLGASQARVMWLHTLQLLMLATLACGVGVGLGWLTQKLLVSAMSGLLLGALPAASPLPALTGVSIGFAALLGFALPPLMALGRVPPARVLRRELGGVGGRRALSSSLAVFTVLALVLWQARDTNLALYVLGGGIAAVGVLLGSAWLAVRLLSSMRERVGVSWRFGVANLVRRAHSSAVQVAAFGLGLCMLLLLTLVRHDLLNEWQASLPEDAPNYFLVNVQDAEVAAIETLLHGRGLSSTELHPMIRGRLLANNGRPVSAADYDNPRAKRRLDHDFNLSYAQRLRPDNRVVAGRIWPASGSHPGQLSVEKGMAELLGLKLGDRLTFRIAGVDTEGTITSLREVDWDSFRVNFFVVASPGTLDGFAATHITSFFLPESAGDLLVGLIRAHPTVTVIDVDALLSKVRAIMNRASRGIEFVFVFTLLAGLTVLYAAVHSTLDERRYETAMLRTLGAKRSTIFKGLTAEFALLGLLAGALASVAASGLGMLVAERILGVAYAPSLSVWLLGPVVGAIGIAAAGVLGTRSVINHPPMSTLQSAPPAA